MSAAERLTTPPRNDSGGGTTPGILPRAPLTPEQIKRIETNRLKAKAIREQREAEARQQASSSSSPNLPQPSSRAPKRPYASSSLSEIPRTLRDGRNASITSPLKPGSGIQPAQKFAKYVDYDFSKMTDTKGGFLTLEDDPHNKALHSRRPGDEERPAHMTLKEWERHQLLKSLRDSKTGPYEPGLSVIKGGREEKKCFECGTLEIDFKWEEVFGCRVCATCKDKRPEKYSLLTKTEAREDYLLTDPELKDEELLPHLEKPNPHKATWNNMMLYLRYQVEEYAFSAKKWGSPEALDAEFAKREAEKKKQKEKKFNKKLHELKKRTRVEAYRRDRATGGKGGGNFGDDVGGGGKHVHQWGRTIDDPETGIGVKTCVDCGMEVEELEF